MKQIAGVYKITNLTNNKIYIGSSADIKGRWIGHINTKKGYLLSRAIRKYGLENFNFEIIEEKDSGLLKSLLRKTLIETEQKYLDLYQPWPENNGYNICRIAGSTLGTKRTNKQRKNISNARKKQNLTGVNSKSSKSVHLLDPYGNVVFFECIKNGCTDYGLNQRHISSIITGRRYQHKGWRLYDANEIGQPPANKKIGHTSWNKGRTMRYSPKGGKLAKGVKRPWQDGKARSEHRKKEYTFIDPQGNIHNIIGLNEFCIERGLHTSNMAQLARGKYKSVKGWTIPMEMNK